MWPSANDPQEAIAYGILKASDSGNLECSNGVVKEIKRHKTYPEAMFKKDARINIRLSSKDLRALQTRALQEGILYQTLVASVLHNYVDGQLKENNG